MLSAAAALPREGSGGLQLLWRRDCFLILYIWRSPIEFPFLSQTLEACLTCHALIKETT